MAQVVSDAVWIAVCLIAVCVVVWFLMTRLDPVIRRLRAFNAEMVSREHLTDAQMMDRYFAGSDVPIELTGQVRRIFAKHMECPAEKLLPDEDLSFFWYDLDLMYLIQDLEKTFAIKIGNGGEFRTPCNIRSVSLLVQQLMESDTVVV